MDYTRTLMIKKNVWQKFWREGVSITIYTLNRAQVKKGTNQIHCELWYGYAPNVKYLEVFGRKCYILKDTWKGKNDAKNDKGIFLGYSTKSKAYKCLNTNTKKFVESANVRAGEFVEKNEEWCKNEPKDYKNFAYIYEGEPSTLPKQEKKVFEHQIEEVKSHKEETKHQSKEVELHKEIPRGDETSWTNWATTRRNKIWTCLRKICKKTPCTWSNNWR